MDEDEGQYNVRIHFPYAQVVLYEPQMRWQVERIKECHRAGVNYIVSNGGTQYLVNPALVTHIEIREITPFGG